MHNVTELLFAVVSPVSASCVFGLCWSYISDGRLLVNLGLEILENDAINHSAGFRFLARINGLKWIQDFATNADAAAAALMSGISGCGAPADCA